MERLSNNPREAFEQKIYNQGLIYWPTPLPDGRVKSYWNDRAHYAFTADDIKILERATYELFNMCVNAGDAMLADPAFLAKAQIPEWTHEAIRLWWEYEPARGSVYSRFDLRYGGNSYLSAADPTLDTPLLLEYNADTPTSFPESTIVQWEWFKANRHLGDDQYNQAYEDLVDAFARNLKLIEDEHLGFKPVVYFAYDGAEESGEDMANTEALRAACGAAGYETRLILVQDIWMSPPPDARIYDTTTGDHIDVIFKLYPWEWLAHPKKFGKLGEKEKKLLFIDVTDTGPHRRVSRREDYRGGTIWMEPPWKLLWSNKALMVMLWKLYGNTEQGKYLLPSYFEDEKPAGMRDYVVKPLLAREGSNMKIVVDDEVVYETPGEYSGPYMVQALSRLPNFPGLSSTGEHTDNHPVIGVWVIDGAVVGEENGEEAPRLSGLAIRESVGLITDNTSQFTPHVILNNPRRLSDGS